MEAGKTVKDVSPHEFVKAYSAHLKRSGKIELPPWTDIVKTATFKELAPYDPDWYYIRAASMARKVYLRGGLGVGAFKRIYGGSKRNGSRPPHFCRSSGSIARHILQQGKSSLLSTWFVPSEMDLEEFAADVELLLGKRLDDDESFGIDGLGLMMEVEGSSSMMEDTTSVRCSSGTVMIKDEDKEEKEMEEIEMANKEVFDLDFDYNDGDQETDDKVEVFLDDEEKTILSKKRKILLRLDYESILSAWDGPSPWAAGARPDVDPNDQCWPICTATCQIESHQMQLGDNATCLNGRIGMSVDGGREARVSRYREKRRTRLFSKKIRYEVRKLNAEKRPRMKGRFVKRPLSSFPPNSNVSLFS